MPLLAMPSVQELWEPVLSRTHLWEVTLAVANQQAGLATAAIADDNNLLRVCWGLRGLCGR